MACGLPQTLICDVCVVRGSEPFCAGDELMQLARFVGPVVVQHARGVFCLVSSRRCDAEHTRGCAESSSRNSPSHPPFQSLLLVPVFLQTCFLVKPEHFE